MIYSDYHMHTAFSTDSEAPAETMIEAAIAKGLTSVCITDHYDKDYPFYEDLGENAFLLDLDSYFGRLQELQEKYADKITVRIGIETGLQPHLAGFYEELTKQYPFDFVIGSVHLVDGKDPYYREQYHDIPDKELYYKAFCGILENLETCRSFDVLGHIDYVVRYGQYREKDYSYEAYRDILDQILKKVLSIGKGIEINTAGLKYGLPFCNPRPEIIRRYRELGGEIITVGADGHKPEHVAYDFDKAGEILKQCGFRYYTEFVGRKPVFRPIL